MDGKAHLYHPSSLPKVTQLVGEKTETWTCVPDDPKSIDPDQHIWVVAGKAVWPEASERPGGRRCDQQAARRPGWGCWQWLWSRGLAPDRLEQRSRPCLHSRSTTLADGQRMDGREPGQRLEDQLGFHHKTVHTGQDGALMQGGSSGGDEKWSHSEDIIDRIYGGIRNGI